MEAHRSPLGIFLDELELLLEVGEVAKVKPLMSLCGRAWALFIIIGKWIFLFFLLNHMPLSNLVKLLPIWSFLAVLVMIVIILAIGSGSAIVIRLKCCIIISLMLLMRVLSLLLSPSVPSSCVHLLQEITEHLDDIYYKN